MSLAFDKPTNARPEEYSIEPDGRVLLVFNGDEFQTMTMEQKADRAARVWGADWRERAGAERVRQEVKGHAQA